MNISKPTWTRQAARENTQYNHSWDPSTAVPLGRVSVYWDWPTIIHGMRLLQHRLCKYLSTRYSLQPSIGCVYGGTNCESVSISSYGLRSSMGCIYYNTPRASIGLLVWSSSKDASTAAPLAHLSVVGYDQKSSMGCVYGGITWASVSLLGTVYNHPWDASTSAPLVQVPVYWVRSSIIHGMRLQRHHLSICQFIGYGLQSFMGLHLLLHGLCMYWSTGYGLPPSKRCALASSPLPFLLPRSTWTFASPTSILFILHGPLILLTFIRLSLPLGSFLLPRSAQKFTSPEIALVLPQDCGLSGTFVHS